MRTKRKQQQTADLFTPVFHDKLNTETKYTVNKPF